MFDRVLRKAHRLKSMSYWMNKQNVISERGTGNTEFLATELSERPAENCSIKQLHPALIALRVTESHCKRTRGNQTAISKSDDYSALNAWGRRWRRPVAELLAGMPFIEPRQCRSRCVIVLNAAMWLPVCFRTVPCPVVNAPASYFGDSGSRQILSNEYVCGFCVILRRNDSKDDRGTFDFQL